MTPASASHGGGSSSSSSSSSSSVASSPSASSSSGSSCVASLGGRRQEGGTSPAMPEAGSAERGELAAPPGAAETRAGEGSMGGRAGEAGRSSAPAEEEGEEGEVEKEEREQVAAPGSLSVEPSTGQPGPEGGEEEGEQVHGASAAQRQLHGGDAGEQGMAPPLAGEVGGGKGHGEDTREGGEKMAGEAPVAALGAAQGQAGEPAAVQAQEGSGQLAPDAGTGATGSGSGLPEVFSSEDVFDGGVMGILARERHSSRVQREGARGEGAAPKDTGGPGAEVAREEAAGDGAAGQQPPSPIAPASPLPPLVQELPSGADIGVGFSDEEGGGDAGVLILEGMGRREFPEAAEAAGGTQEERERQEVPSRAVPQAPAGAAAAAAEEAEEEAEAEGGLAASVEELQQYVRVLEVQVLEQETERERLRGVLREGGPGAAYVWLKSGSLETTLHAVERRRGGGGGAGTGEEWRSEVEGEQEEWEEQWLRALDAVESAQRRGAGGGDSVWEEKQALFEGRVRVENAGVASRHLPLWLAEWGWGESKGGMGKREAEAKVVARGSIVEISEGEAEGEGNKVGSQKEGGAAERAHVLRGEMEEVVGVELPVSTFSSHAAANALRSSLWFGHALAGHMPGKGAQAHGASMKHLVNMAVNSTYGGLVSIVDAFLEEGGAGAELVRRRGVLAFPWAVAVFYYRLGRRLLGTLGV